MNNYCIRVAWRDAAKTDPVETGISLFYTVDVMTVTIKRCTCYHPFSTLWKIQDGFDDELNFAHRCQWLEAFQTRFGHFAKGFHRSNGALRATVESASFHAELQPLGRRNSVGILHVYQVPKKTIYNFCCQVFRLPKSVWSNF